jgi:hypothetical protein
MRTSKGTRLTSMAAPDQQQGGCYLGAHIAPTQYTRVLPNAAALRSSTSSFERHRQRTRMQLHNAM